MKKLFFLSLLIGMASATFAQIFDPVKWDISASEVNENTWSVKLTASIDEGWHLYGTNIPDGGPIATSFSFAESDNYSVQGALIPLIAPKKKYDETFEMELELYDGKASFEQLVVLNKAQADIEVVVEYMCCDDNRCLPPTEKTLKITLGGDKKETGINTDNQDKKSENQTPSFQINRIEEADQPLVTEKDEVPPMVEADKEQAMMEQAPALEDDSKPQKKGQTDKTLWAIFIASLIGGLAGIFTPCVYPMIPMTVSFFMRGNKNKGQALFNGLFFGFSIIAIYTLIGVLIAVFQTNFIGSIVNHWLTNLIFFALFLVFAISFFGAFEIVLPSGMANKVDQKADKAGLLGPFFMALTTVIVSFSCTGPIIGALLVKAVQGDVMQPIIGMFGFSLVFALPFTIFAIFPGMMQSLPKSGGWLNAVKVVLGFIVLAFSMIFLINAFPNLLSRELYLSIWIALSLLLTGYLLGKIKFPHDSELKHISISRVFFAIAFFAFAIYLFTGFLGNKLTTFGSMLPMKSEITTPIQSSPVTTAQSNAQYPGICEKPSYADKLHLPHGLQGYFDFEEGLACAKEQNKPLLLDFKGHFCKNCKDMEARVWSDPEVLKLLREEFVIVAFFTDDRTELAEAEWYTSSLDNKIKKTLGKQHADFQAEKFGTNAIPLYAVVGHNGELLTDGTFAYDPDVEKYLNWLQSGLENFNE